MSSHGTVLHKRSWGLWFCPCGGVLLKLEQPQPLTNPYPPLVSGHIQPPVYCWFWTPARHSYSANGKVAPATALLRMSDGGGSVRVFLFFICWCCCSGSVCLRDCWAITGARCRLDAGGFSWSWHGQLAWHWFLSPNDNEIPSDVNLFHCPLEVRGTRWTSNTDTYVIKPTLLAISCYYLHNQWRQNIISIHLKSTVEFKSNIYPLAGWFSLTAEGCVCCQILHLVLDLLYLAFGARYFI